MPDSPVATVSDRYRLVLGGLGALTPILLSAVVVDMRMLMQKAGDPVELIGYVIRVLALFGAGALTAWLHKQEVDERKLFQLGMIAPALLTTMLNGAKVPPPSAAPTANAPAVESPAKTQNTGPVGLSAFFVTPLHAQQQQRRVYSFEDPPPPPSAGQRFLNGFLGISSGQGNYFVAVDEGKFSTSEEAFRRLVEVQRLDTDFRRNAKVFRSPAAGGGFLVVLGGWLDIGRVRKMVEDAGEEGVPVLVFTDRTAAQALAGERAQR